MVMEEEEDKEKDMWAEVVERAGALGDVKEEKKIRRWEDYGVRAINI